MGLVGEGEVPMCGRLSFLCDSSSSRSLGLTVSALILSVWLTGHAAELDNWRVPDAVEVAGETLHLNGMGRRIYSVLGIPVYVACLYLEQLSSDAERIIQSAETKLLVIKFERDVDADQAREAWRNGLEKNCRAPCHLDPRDLARFLAGIRDVHRNDTYSFLFTQTGVTVTLNGVPMATIPRPTFARAMLATFLGPEPASLALKESLLEGGRGVER